MNASFTLRVTPGKNALTRAIARLPRDPAVPAVLHLSPGVYREKVVLARANTTLEGESAADTRIVWDDGARAILQGGEKRGTFRTATLRTDAPGITLRGLTIENAASPREEAGQAIALYADGDGLRVEDCVLIGHQDTLFTAPLPPKEIERNGFIGPKQFAPRTPQRHTYQRCRIIGDVDFIFGGAAAWFEQCDIVSIDGRASRDQPGTGYVTAASTPEGQPFGYVFSRCRFLSGECPPASVYLGRPWREWARVILLDCELGAHIIPAGFDDWQKPLAHKTAFFAEHGSFGPGASGPRADFARTLTAGEAASITYARFMSAHL